MVAWRNLARESMLSGTPVDFPWWGLGTPDWEVSGHQVQLLGVLACGHDNGASGDFSPLLGWAV